MLDDVIRSKTVRACEVYKRFKDPDLDLSTLDLSTNDLRVILGMDYDEYDKFMYEDYPFEIFANAPVTKKGVDKEMILWHIGLQDYEGTDEEIRLSLTNPYEFNASIGSTYFFLSRIATRIRDVYFPADSDEIWDNCDVLVTADPRFIREKPYGKICVKIEMPYNKDVDADITYKNLSEAFKDNDILDKIFVKKKELLQH